MRRCGLYPYLDAKPKGKFGVHRYDPARLGLDESGLRNQFADCRALRRRTGGRMSERPDAAAVFDDLIAALTGRDDYVLDERRWLTEVAERFGTLGQVLSASSELFWEVIELAALASIVSPGSQTSRVTTPARSPLRPDQRGPYVPRARPYS